MKMTKRFHKCGKDCKVNHVKRVDTRSEPKKEVTIENVNRAIKKKIKEVKPKKTLSLIDEIDFYVCKIDNDVETNKILEKTIIKLRKLEQDLA